MRTFFIVVVTIFEVILLIVAILFWALTAEADTSLVGNVATVKEPSNPTTDFVDQWKDPLTEYHSGETGELLQLDKLVGDWNVVDVEEFIDLTIEGEPTKFKLFLEPVPDMADAEPAMLWYGGEGPFYFEEIDEFFETEQLP